MNTHDNDPLLDQLRTLANRLDPVPERVADGARAALTWRTIDAELAALTYDSLEEERPLSGIRGEGGPRFLTFAVPAVTVEVEVTEVGMRRRLVGQLVPAQTGRIEVRQPDGVTVIEVDELGRFQADDVAAGATSLRCHLVVDDQTIVVDTDWHVL